MHYRLLRYGLLRNRLLHYGLLRHGLLHYGLLYVRVLSDINGRHIIPCLLNRLLSIRILLRVGILLRIWVLLRIRILLRRLRLCGLLGSEPDTADGTGRRVLGVKAAVRTFHMYHS